MTAKFADIIDPKPVDIRTTDEVRDTIRKKLEALNSQGGEEQT